MLTVEFYNKGAINVDKIKFVVVVAFYNNQLIIVRHKDRKTWEIPGGHKEDFETCEEAAERELFEETGARLFDLDLVCTYSVNRADIKSYGQLYVANVRDLGTLPESEIEEVKMVKELPENLTYPLIQPHLYRKVLTYFNSQTG